MARAQAEGSDTSVGTVLGGRYELEALLGEGGMGAVYRGRDTRTGERYAVKVLKNQSAEFITRFVRETRIAVGMRHPNVVRIHEVIQLDDASPILVMELLQGESLGTRLAREGKLRIEALAPIALAIVAGVRAAHARGVVHRDLKPDNVFLCAARGEGSVKVLDFGIAKVVTDAANPPVTAATLTRTGQVLGTPQYMAPEQIFGEKNVDARVDVWALGVIFYEALSGARPFNGENVGQIFKAVALDPLVPLETRAPWVPAEVAALVGRMLSHSRDDRLADLRIVERVLAPYANGPTMSAADIGSATTLLAVPAPSGPPRSARSAKNNRQRLAWSVAVVAAAAGIALGVKVSGVRNPNRTPGESAIAAATLTMPVEAPSVSEPRPAPSAPPSATPSAPEARAPAESVGNAVPAVSAIAAAPPPSRTKRATAKPTAPPSGDVIAPEPAVPATPPAPSVARPPNRSGSLSRSEF